MNPLNRTLAGGIRRVGLRQRYERELLSSHAHMLLAFLCVIALMASMEAFHGATPREKAADVLPVIVSGATGLWARRWRRDGVLREMRTPVDDGALRTREARQRTSASAA